DLLLVNSNYVKASFINNGFPEEKIRIAELGVDESFNGLKTNYSLNSAAIRLLFTGNFGNRKGAAIIVGAVQILKAKGVRFSLSIVGNVAKDFIIPDWFANDSNINF